MDTPASSRRFPADFRLLLASRSPRRSGLLEAVGVPFEVVASTAVERQHGTDPVALAEANALAKAEGAVLPVGAGPGVFVLGTDTIVVVDGRVLGKPADVEQAREMLRMLVGRTHEVVSGVAVVRLGPRGRQHAHAVGHAVTEVHMTAFSPRDRESYLQSGEWHGKAGGYAIQGLAALLVDRIEGDYSNVVGLPLRLVGRLFLRLGFDLLGGAWSDTDTGAEDPRTGGRV